MPATFQTVVPGCKTVPNYWIGDPAYPLTLFCMKELNNCNSDEEVTFNNMLRSARNQIECLFGRLKARWAILSRKMDLKLEVLPTVICACSILLNYWKKKNKSRMDEEVVKSQIEIPKKNKENYKNVPDPIFSFDFGEGTITRKTVTQYLKDCS